MIPTINHWVGQDEAIRRFRVALEAAWNDGSRLPHMLFVGGAGLGKTELAHLAAREMGVTLHERLAQVVGNMAAMNGLLLSVRAKEIVFLDEIHELPPGVQTILYRAMEGSQITLRNREEQTMNMPLADFTIIGATTDEFRLLGPLRDRFKIILPFDLYELDALTTITLQRAGLLGIEIDERIGREIALRAKGTPRLAIRILESCHRCARAKGESRITLEHFHETLRIDGLDALGLGSEEQRYLRFLASRHGNPVRLFTMESALGIHRRTIQTVIEPFLIRSGLVERHQQGRVITSKGLEHLGILTEQETSVA